MQPRNRGFVQGLEAVLAGHEDGLIKLPDDIAGLLTAFDYIDAETRKVDQPTDGYAELSVAIGEAALSGAPLPTIEEFIRRGHEIGAYTARRAALSDQLERMANRLRAAIQQGCDEIITNSVRPVHSAAVTKITASMTALGGQIDAASLLNASQSKRTARLDLDQATRTYGACRAIHVSLLRFRHVAQFNGLDVEFSNASAFKEHGTFGGSDPAPTDPTLRIVHYLSLGLVPWLPTISELEMKRSLGGTTPTPATTTTVGTQQSMPSATRLGGDKSDGRVRGGRAVTA